MFFAKALMGEYWLSLAAGRSWHISRFNNRGITTCWAPISALFSGPNPSVLPWHELFWNSKKLHASRQWFDMRTELRSQHFSVSLFQKIEVCDVAFLRGNENLADLVFEK